MCCDTLLREETKKMQVALLKSKKPLFSLWNAAAAAILALLAGVIVSTILMPHDVTGRTLDNVDMRQLGDAVQGGSLTTIFIFFACLGVWQITKWRTFDKFDKDFRRERPELAKYMANWEILPNWF
jgi:hypothetical protein